MNILSFFCHLFWLEYDDWLSLMHGFDFNGIFIVFFFHFSTRRFPGYSREGKKFDAEVHRQHIFGLHVANYMTSLKEENPDLYAKQFSRFVKAGIQPTSVRQNFNYSFDYSTALFLVRSFIQSCTCCHPQRSITITEETSQIRCT